MIAILFPHINPVAFQVGPLPIRWYALAYIAGILLGIAIMKYLTKQKTHPLVSNEVLEDMLAWIVFGIIFGGRLGYILFYNLDAVLADPLLALKIWKGGMSFHGGCLGLALSIAFFCRLHKLPFLYIADLIACVAPIGIFFGRIANFIKGELYGRVSDVPWAMIFPDGGLIPRHPSQLYEAFLEGILLQFIMLTLFFKTRAGHQEGRLFGFSLFFYALLRSAAEQFRQPDEPIGLIGNTFSMGQILSAPMLLIGLYLVTHKRK
jgi:phosphatidylglycerol:prolipoprotein diacylglycerol transferase